MAAAPGNAPLKAKQAIGAIEKSGTRSLGAKSSCFGAAGVDQRVRPADSRRRSPQGRPFPVGRSALGFYKNDRSVRRTSTFRQDPFQFSERGVAARTAGMNKEQ